MIENKYYKLMLTFCLTICKQNVIICIYLLILRREMGYIKKIDEKEKDSTKVVGARVSEDVLNALSLAEEDANGFGFSISITDIIKQALNNTLIEIKEETKIDYYKFSKWMKKIKTTYLQVSRYADVGVKHDPIFKDFTLIEKPNLSGEDVVSHYNDKKNRLHNAQDHISKLINKSQTTISSLDLHSMKLEDICLHISYHIHYFSDHKFIQIIHGKGYHSDDGLSIIKSQVVHYLKQHPQVYAFCSCPQKSGGTGALWVQLRETDIEFQIEEFAKQLRREMLIDIKIHGDFEQALIGREEQLYFSWNAALEREGSNLMVEANGQVMPRPGTSLL